MQPDDIRALRAQAAACRKLLTSVTLPDTAKVLRDMAEGYDARAERLEREARQPGLRI